jgi:Holliday junction resolvase
VNNKQAGNKFEREFCEQLARDGFWAHFMGGSKNGQPADIIAVRNEHAYLIDAKDCQNDRFPLSRIEDNQDMAMRYWEMCGNNQGLFALNTSKGVYMLPYGMVQVFEIAGIKSLNMQAIEKYCTPYEEWRLYA